MSEETPPQPSPLDAERQQLRAQGYNDAEISQILIARALGGTAGPTSAPVHPQGVFSNVLSSIVAVAGYVGGLFTSVRQDVATILDRSAPARVRTGAFAAIAVKAAVIGVLAYVGLQEWQQHINSATEIAAAQAKKLQIEADNAKALNEAQVKKLEAEAAVAKQVNDAQAQKLRADADAAKALNDAQVRKLEAEAAVAKQVNDAQAEKLRADAAAAKALNDAQVKKLEAEAAVAKQVNEAQAVKLKADAAVADEVAAGAKARSCSERLELITKNIDPDDVDWNSSTFKIKPGTGSAAMLEKYNRECGGITGRDSGQPTVDETKILDLYRGLVSSLLDNRKPSDKFKMDEKDAALEASCFIGVRVEAALQNLDDKDANDRVVNSLLECRDASITYALTKFVGDAFSKQYELSTARDDATRASLSALNIGHDIRACMADRFDFAGFVACTCRAGVNLGIVKAGSNDDVSAKQTVVDKSGKVCDSVALKIAESDSAAAAKFREFSAIAARREQTPDVGAGRPTQSPTPVVSEPPNPQPSSNPWVGVERVQDTPVKTDEITGAFNNGYWSKSRDLSRQNAAEVEVTEVQETGRAGEKTAQALSNLGYYALFARDFAAAFAASERAITLNPSDLVPVTNQAHALMFMGHRSEAKSIYLRHRGEFVLGKSWEVTIREDFAEFRKRDLANSLMEEVEAEFAPALSGMPTSTHSASAPPEPAPTPLRTPANFDCVNGKHMGTDYLICGSPYLLDMEAQLEDAYQAAHAGPKADRIRAEQIEWIKSYGPACGLPYRGEPSTDQSMRASSCVAQAMDRRIRELQQER